MKRIRNLVIWIVVIYLLVSGIKIGIPYIRNVMFADEVDNIARGLNYDGTVARATNRLMEAVRSNKIPVTEKDFTIRKDEKTSHTLVEVKYSVTVATPFGLYTHVWNFNPRAEYGQKQSQ
jgi:hypothetical protein